MTAINYVTGDATQPAGSGHKVIIHVCNDVNAWGAGFVLALSKRWFLPEQTFHSARLKLGDIQVVSVEPDITVINMIGQTGVGRRRGKQPPIRYEAIRDCLEKVATEVKQLNASVHSPKFGAGLAGGKWEIIEALIKSELCEKDIQVTVYDFPVPTAVSFVSPTTVSTGPTDLSSKNKDPNDITEI